MKGIITKSQKQLNYNLNSIPNTSDDDDVDDENDPLKIEFIKRHVLACISHGL